MKDRNNRHFEFSEWAHPSQTFWDWFFFFFAKSLVTKITKILSSNLSLTHVYTFSNGRDDTAVHFTCNYYKQSDFHFKIGL